MTRSTIREMATRTDSAPVFSLEKARLQPAKKSPAAHQAEALRELRQWAEADHAVHGGILVLPTGGGKTFTATRFLTTGPLTRGHKVLWLAHTHHLLDQALRAFGQPDDKGYEVGHVRGDRKELRFRTVSGTEGHGRAWHVAAEDDVVIITLQTLARAVNNGKLPGLTGFLKAAKKTGLTVVFDECHHAPAPTYRRLIEALRTQVPDLHLLGLTATPTYTDERRQGTLKKLFPQGILYEVDTQRLMAQGVLSRPHIEQAATHIEATFDEREFRQWIGSFRDLPEKIIEQLARNAERNAIIADKYVSGREKYGKTIIFADRFYQCDALVSLLKERGVKAAAVYSHLDANPGNTEARNARIRDENHTALEKFRQGDLEVLVNIRMLTEGTDVPEVQTVFLTRQTTSRILLTQMIGRALRGPKFGGTKDAYIVAFIDDWKQHVAWARWDELADIPVEEVERAVRQPLPVTWVSSELIEQLAQALDRGEGGELPFMSYVPVGWYATEFSSAGQDDQGQAVSEVVKQLVPVFDNDVEGFQKLQRVLPKHTPDTPFDELTLSKAALNQAHLWTENCFTKIDRLTRVEQDVLAVLRHWGQSGSFPAFTPFETREEYDLDSLARESSELGFLKLDEQLRAEYAEQDKLWRFLYPRYELFRAQVQQSQARYADSLIQETPQPSDVATSQAITEGDEAPAETKAQVLERDGHKCLCCGSTYRVNVDHIQPRSLGGSHDPENLQALCSTCNRLKGIEKIDFRASKAPKGFQPITVNLQQVGDVTKVESLERLVRRVVNMHYGYAAVSQVLIGQRGPKAREWEVILKKGGKVDSLLPKLEALRERVNKERAKLRRQGVDTIWVMKS